MGYIFGNCQKPNLTKTSIQQSLSLDYILTVISTTPPHPTPPGTHRVVVVVNCPASSLRKAGARLTSA